MTKKEKLMVQPTEEHIRELLRKRNEGTEDCILSSDIASEFGISAPDLHHFLIEVGILYREKGTRELKPCAKYRQQGLTMTRSYFHYTRTGELKETRYPVWTKEGAEFLRKTLRNKK